MNNKNNSLYNENVQLKNNELNQLFKINELVANNEELLNDNRHLKKQIDILNINQIEKD